MPSFRAVRFAVPFSKDSYSYSLWGRPGTPLLRTARSPKAQNPLIDTLTAPARSFLIFFFLTLLPLPLNFPNQVTPKEPRTGRKERGPGSCRRFLWVWREEWKPLFFITTLKFWEMWAKEVLWNCFKDRDEVGGQVPRARWGGLFLGKRGGTACQCARLNWFALDFFS